MLYTVYVSNYFGYNRPVCQTEDKSRAVAEANKWAKVISILIGETPMRPLRRIGANRFRWRTPNGVTWVWIAPSTTKIEEP